MKTKNDNEEKIFLALKNRLKIHITLKSGEWRNGFVTDVSADFFTFNDTKEGLEHHFFLDLVKVEPFTEGKK